MVIASIAVSYVSSSNLPYIPLLFTYFSKKKKKKTKKQKTKKQKQKIKNTKTKTKTKTKNSVINKLQAK